MPDNISIYKSFNVTKINKMGSKELIDASHIGEGLYFTDYGYEIKIAVNHHHNTVAYLDIGYLDKAIEYLQKVKKRIENETK